MQYLKKEVAISFVHSLISLRQLVELLATIGYEPMLSLDDYEFKPQKKKASSLIVRLAVAGFCFANIMLFSFPEYLSTDGLIEPEFQKFFGYLNILLSIPVFFYSGALYYKSAYTSLKQKVINMDVPITIGIFMLYFRSLYEVISTTGPGYFDSFTGLVFFLLIGKFFQQRTYDSLSFDRDYKSYFPISITRITNSGEEIIPISELEKGDVIIVRNNELIPADSVLLSETASIDYSFVTGEAEHTEKNENDKIYAGGKQAGASIRLKVLKSVSQSYITQLWDNASFNFDDSHSLTNLANRFSKYFTFGIITIALLAGIIWYFIDPSKAVFITTAVLIIACPCALALSTPFTLGSAQRILGRNQLFLKNSSTIEELAKINHIIFDKTGTLTEASNASIRFSGKTLSQYDNDLIYSLIQHSTHTLSVKLLKQITAEKSFEVSEYSEIPGKGISGLVQNHKLKIGSATFVGQTNDTKLNETRVYYSLNDEIVGYFIIENWYREGLASLAEKLSGNLQISILSGDNESEKSRLQTIFPRTKEFRFNQSPQDKLDFIKSLQKDDTVLMFGDGLNDAGALKQSNIGIAVVENISSFSPASDGILNASNFSKISEFITFSHKSIFIILVSFAISLLYNLFGIGFAVAGYLSPLFAAVLMPLSSITVVIFTTVATKVAAKRIGLS
ncbi:MAG: HAD family hydrolase [Calditrichaeota bacterium]|nr:MAG: HAD family hydrolase [Calditrichota bacterium]